MNNVKQSIVAKKKEMKKKRKKLSVELENYHLPVTHRNKRVAPSTQTLAGRWVVCLVSKSPSHKKTGGKQNKHSVMVHSHNPK
jgi:hypothetical protein